MPQWSSTTHATDWPTLRGRYFLKATHNNFINLNVSPLSNWLRRCTRIKQALGVLHPLFTNALQWLAHFAGEAFPQRTIILPTWMPFHYPINYDGVQGLNNLTCLSVFPLSNKLQQCTRIKQYAPSLAMPCNSWPTLQGEAFPKCTTILPP